MEKPLQKQPDPTAGNRLIVKNKFRLTPVRTIILGYFLIISAGALLLMLPVSARSGAHTPFMDAFFTACSATCVTGLVVYDTFTYWSIFGQLLILCMIQIGGIGFMTLAISALSLTKAKIGLRNRYMVQEAVNAPQMGGIVRMTRFILGGTALIEGAGALLLALRFCPKLGFWKGLYFAVFHSISAFCNAGFDLMGENGEFSSLVPYASDAVVNLVVSALIILGGIGFFVWSDIADTGLRFRKFRLHTKIVLSTTAALITVSFLIFLLFERHSPAFKGMSLGETLMAALFQVITPRTAGFNTVDLTRLSDASHAMLIGLMVIGASPSSTGGGFKTTTLAVLAFSVRTEIKRKKEIDVFGRRISTDIQIQSLSLVALYILLFTLAGMLLCTIDGISMREAMFETASAIGTVGLSLGITPSLSPLSQFILTGLMFFGRVGGLTLLLSIRESKSVTMSHMPVEPFTIG